MQDNDIPDHNVNLCIDMAAHCIFVLLRCDPAESAIQSVNWNSSSQSQSAGWNGNSHSQAAGWNGNSRSQLTGWHGASHNQDPYGAYAQPPELEEEEDDEDEEAGDTFMVSSSDLWWQLAWPAHTCSLAGDVLWPLAVGLASLLWSASSVLAGCLLLGCKLCHSTGLQRAGAYPVQSIWLHLQILPSIRYPQPPSSRSITPREAAQQAHPPSALTIQACASLSWPWNLNRPICVQSTAPFTLLAPA